MASNVIEVDESLTRMVDEYHEAFKAFTSLSLFASEEEFWAVKTRFTDACERLSAYVAIQAKKEAMSHE